MAYQNAHQTSCHSFLACLAGVGNAFAQLGDVGQMMANPFAAIKNMITGNSLSDQYTRCVHSNGINTSGSDYKSRTVTGQVLIGIGGLAAGPLFAGADAADAADAGLQSAADAVHGVLDPIAQEMRTTAVIRPQTGAGNMVDVFAGSGRGLTAAQKELISQMGGIVAPNIPDADAEVTALEYVQSQGWNPVAGAASRPVCPICTNILVKNGANMVGPLYPYRYMGQQVLGATRFGW